MSEPVSWLLIEPGWEVVDANGKTVGPVEDVVADQDIFSGLVVATGLLKRPRFVPAERVAEISEGRVRLELRGDEIDRLEDYQPPAPA